MYNSIILLCRHCKIRYRFLVCNELNVRSKTNSKPIITANKLWNSWNCVLQIPKPSSRSFIDNMPRVSFYPLDATRDSLYVSSSWNTTFHGISLFRRTFYGSTMVVNRFYDWKITPTEFYKHDAPASSFHFDLLKASTYFIRNIFIKRQYKRRIDEDLILIPSVACFLLLLSFHLFLRSSSL